MSQMAPLLTTRSIDTLRSDDATTQISEELRLEFIKHVDDYLFNGYDGRGKKKYVSTEALYEYWTQPRLDRARLKYGRDLNWSYIRTNYMRVFSLLVYEGFGDMIKEFTRRRLSDQVFPCSPLPHRMSESRLFEKCIASFAKQQWMFFPLQLPFEAMHECEIPMERIVPLLSKDKISGDENDSACVFKVTLDPGCNENEDYRENSLNSTHKTFVLKSYQKSYPGATQSYKREVAYYAAIENTKCPCVLKSYGQYEQGDRLNIILEFMNLGNLSDYMRNNTPPKTPTDMIEFWEPMQGILAALTHLHDSNGYKDPKDPFTIFHRDIKPDNILLSTVAESSGAQRPPPFRAVIGDPGCSEVFLPNHRNGQKNPEETGIRTSTTGDQMYCAPEACRSHRDVRNASVRITSRSDIFSLGAVWSELAVWTILGYSGVEDYRDSRIKEHQEHHGNVNDGSEGCFHDGHRTLESVKRTLEYTRREACNASHTVTEDIIGLIEHYMLLPEHSERWEAPRLHEEFGRKIREARGILRKGPATNHLHNSSPPFQLEQSSHTPGRNRSSSTKNSILPSALYNRGPRIRPGWLALPSTPQPRAPGLQRKPSTKEQLSIQEVLEWRHDEKYRTNQAPRSVQITIDKLCKNVNDRDHMFFIIDSPTLGDYGRRVNEVFTALSYLAKKMDDNGIELIYASSTEKYIKGTTTSHMIKSLRRHEYAYDPAKTEASFEALIKTHMLPRLRRKKNKPLSVYIFTDGVWGNDYQTNPAYGIDRPIEDLVTTLRGHHVGRTHVMLQFISFGDDPGGLQALEFLDNLQEDWDICDTTRSTGNVYKMFYGSINREIDQEGDGSGDPVSNQHLDTAEVSSRLESYHPFKGRW